MFGLGTSEILVILLVALLVLGPQKLPGIARTLGKTLGEFRRVSSEFQRTLNAEVSLEEQKQKNSAALEKTGAADAFPSPGNVASETAEAPSDGEPSLSPEPAPASPQNARTSTQPQPSRPEG